MTAANFRALWAIIWFLAVYHLGAGRAIAPALPRPPRRWYPIFAATPAPPLVAWGLFCAGSHDQGADQQAAETASARSFAAQVVPLRDDGRRHHADRDGSAPVRVPVAFFSGV